MVIFCLNIFTLKQVFWYFFIIITHSRNEVGGYRKDNFPQAYLLQSVPTPQETTSHFTGEEENMSLYLVASHLSACKVLSDKIKGPYQINQHQCIHKFMSGLSENMPSECRGLCCPALHLVRRVFPHEETGFHSLCSFLAVCYCTLP